MLSIIVEIIGKTILGFYRPCFMGACLCPIILEKMPSPAKSKIVKCFDTIDWRNVFILIVLRDEMLFIVLPLLDKHS